MLRYKRVPEARVDDLSVTASRDRQMAEIRRTVAGEGQKSINALKTDN